MLLNIYIRIMFKKLLFYFSIPIALIAQPSKPIEYKGYIYKYSIEDLLKKQTPIQVKNAEKALEELESTNAIGKYKADFESLDKHKLPEWFADAKFGMFYDWGMWSLAGYDDKGWTRAKYPDTYLGFMYNKSKKYHAKYWGSDFHRDDFIGLFSGKKFDANQITDLALAGGMKYVVPFSKHMDGYCHFYSPFTHRNSVIMYPNRDFTKELFDACKAKNLKYGGYFCNEEFEYPITDKSFKKLIMRNETAANVPGFDGMQSDEKFRAFNSAIDNKLVSGKIPVPSYVNHYFVPLLKDFVDRYDPDILWYDAEWGRTPEYFRTKDISAYMYNKAEGRKEVVINDRYGKGSRQIHGDYNTSEFDEGEKTLDRVWEECRPVGESYGYTWQDNDSTVLTSTELVQLLVRIVAKNGNLLLMVCPDGEGNIPDYQTKRIKDMGDWLKINGEAIYNTRPYKHAICDDLNTGQKVWYTQSKDGKWGYAIFFEWPRAGETVLLRNAKPIWEKNIYLLGYDKPLSPNGDWVDTGEKLWGLTVKLPEEWKNPAKRAGQHAWVIKFETK